MILNIGFKKMPLDPNIDLNDIATNSEGFSGAEMSLICREAGLKALTQDNKIESMNTQEEIDSFKILKHHIIDAMNEVKKRGK